MKTTIKHTLLLLLVAVLLAPMAAAQPGIITTIAGGNERGYSGDGGPATSAQLNDPRGVFVDGAGNIFLSDFVNLRIRKVDASGTITTVAGGNGPGNSGDGGPATSAQLAGPEGVFVDGAGNLFIADINNNAIRKVDASGTITTAFGSSGPAGVFVDGAGNLFIANPYVHEVLKVDPSGTITNVGGPSLSRPWGVAVDGTGNIFIADPANNYVRKVDASGTITTVAGLGAGSPGYSGDGGPAASAQLNNPYGVAVDGAGNLFIADSNNNAIRKVDASGTITTVVGGNGPGYSGDGSSATSAQLNSPRSVFVDGAGNIFISDRGNHSIRMVEGGATNGIAPVPEFSIYWPLDQVTINVDLTSVTNLLGVGAKLSYDDTRLTFDDGSLAAGAFLDEAAPNEPLLFEDDDNAGSASLSVTRISGNSASGSGTAATMTFSVIDYSPPGAANFSLSDILAVDPSGALITLTPTDGAFEVGGVWPGDLDNNCTVAIFDVLPLGLNFGDTGPARTGGFDISWSAKAFSPWGGSSTHADFLKSFVDGTGDGTINQNDLLPIGVNFGQTHLPSTGCPPSAAPKNAAAISLLLDPQPVGTVFTVGLDLVEQTDGLVGTALKLAVDPAVLKVTSVTAGAFLDDGDLLKLVRLNDETGLNEAAFSRKGTERATSGTGVLAVMTLEVVAPMAAASELLLSDVKLSTASAGIFDASEQAVALRTETATASEGEAEVPLTFTLHGAYPNPFNPATTVSFDLPQSATVTLIVFDVLGREVSRVAAGDMAAGSRQTLRFDAQGLASGTYVYRLEAQSAGDLSVQRGQFVLLK